MRSDLKLALELGEPAILPTETVYGLAARADMPTAIDRLYEIKGRASDKPLALCVTNAEMANVYANVTPAIMRLIKAFWPGPLTIVSEAKQSSGLDHRVVGPSGTVGLRCPKASWAETLVWPLALTSANISGGPDPRTFAEAQSAFVPKIAGLDAGACEFGLASTVVQIVDGRAEILRQGGITLGDMEPYL